ncbi:MAG: sugar phosphate isomerase/epimerase [Acidobacteria bacterium]|nr:MAG: sugar phosphate isomerase/epimerase [Acidobacteriota bacterium]
MHNLTRRAMLQSAVGAGAVPALALRGAAAAASGDPWLGLKVGVASYTLRELPLEAAIQGIRRVGVRYASIKDVHLPRKSSAEERRAVIRKFKEAGITPLSCGNVSMQNSEADIRDAFQYARDAGLPTIVCSPHPDSLAILDRLVKEFDIRLAIHNHGPEDKRFPSPYDVWQAVQKYDARIGLCIDVGHSARARVDPAEAIVKCKARLYDLHLKDLASTEPKAATLEVGRGVLDIKGICRALLSIRYQHQVAFEYEKDGDDPLPGLAESVGYVRGLLAGMRDSAPRSA